MISIIASIQPKWCELIASGKKTIEVRKTAPKETPFKVYMYCTKVKDRKKYTDEFDVPMETRKWMGNGKVIGEFVCYKNERFGCSSHDHKILSRQRKSCLTIDEIIDYCNGQDVQGWHISDLIIYDKPRELKEFYRYCGDVPTCKNCNYYYYCESENGTEEECMSPIECFKPITRPPQSWMYCEEVNENDL